MKPKSIAFFFFAVALSLLAATYRWGDSAHAIGLIRASGGEARHAAYLTAGKTGYTLIATATVIPPYRGDARVVLEGDPPIDHEVHLSEPVVDLGIRRNPHLRGDVLHGLRPKDRIALWVVMRPPAVDPVCGMAYQEGFIETSFAGEKFFFCNEGCAAAFRRDPAKYRDNAGLLGQYRLALYDTKSGRPVLTVPVIFKGKGEAADGGHHH
jgi:YHS domain-containing protein